MGRLRPTWSGTWHPSAQSLDAHISVRPSRARCQCLDRGRQQLDLGRSLSPIRLHGTVSRLNCVIPGSVFWLSDVDSRLTCLILLVIYLLSCPLDSYFCIVLVCELLAAFVTIFRKALSDNKIIIIYCHIWYHRHHSCHLHHQCHIIFALSMPAGTPIYIHRYYDTANTLQHP